jgi:hypothetical protein
MIDAQEAYRIGLANKVFPRLNSFLKQRIVRQDFNERGESCKFCYPMQLTTMIFLKFSRDLIWKPCYLESAAVLKISKKEPQHFLKKGNRISSIDNV